MGEVYRAQDPLDARGAQDVADSSPRIRPMARFHREAKYSASLNHPNIALDLRIGGIGRRRALVLELVEGRRSPSGSRAVPIPLDEALPSRGRSPRHSRRPTNRASSTAISSPPTSRCADGTVKVLDFGLAKAMERPAAADGDCLAVANAHRRRHDAGRHDSRHRAYMSPEQAPERVDKRADIWAFGCRAVRDAHGHAGLRRRRDHGHYRRLVVT